MNRITILILSVIILSSCSDEEGPEGLAGNSVDIIKLSTKNVEFDATADSVVITTEGNWWWIDDIFFNDSSYSFFDENINLESDSYIIIGDNFIVERRDRNALFIKLDENITGKERELIIGLQAGDYFDYVIIKQSAK
jgi:hypothetical protein